MRIRVPIWQHIKRVPCFSGRGRKKLNISGGYNYKSAKALEKVEFLTLARLLLTAKVNVVVRKVWILRTGIGRPGNNDTRTLKPQVTPKSTGSVEMVHSAN